MTAAAAIASYGLADPVRDQQSVFRQVMGALAAPGEIREILTAAQPPAPLAPGAAAIALTLADFETPLWLDPPLLASPEVCDYLRFHTGAPIVDSAAQAAFVVISSGDALPQFTDFALGTLEYPDRSATLIVQVARLEAGSGFKLKGPGISGKRKLRIKPLPEDFAERTAANWALFPRGVDLIFVAGNSIAALPRTTRVKD